MAMLRPPPNPPPSPLNEQRIKSLRTEIDAFIDARVENERANCPGIPAGVLRNLLTARSGGCQCEAWLDIAAKDAA